VDDLPLFPWLEDPILFQTRKCVFINPFLAAESKPAAAGMLLYDGNSLARGVVIWQSDGDVYDKRLQFRVAAFKAGVPVLPGEAAPAAWTTLWGRLGNRQSNREVPFITNLDPQKMQLEYLALPGHPSLKDPYPGANLPRMGIKP
jgi:hypothetical protein